jgi:type I restriction enzyme M protein
MLRTVPGDAQDPYRQTMGADTLSSLGNFVWSIADQLRGVYKPHQYGNVILPMTILRRLDCILEPTRDNVRVLAQKYDNPGALMVQVKRSTGLTFYNTSEFDFPSMLADPEGLRANLVDYLTKFSSNIDVFERFKFDNELATLDEKNRLFLVVSKFAEVDLHPDVVPNAEMGDLFEELIRKFAEASNEEAGEHYTPRDAIRLMVDLLFADDSVALLEPGTVRSIYDPTAGTGGMLSVAEERLLERNPEARLALYGQEINDQSYAICKSDMIAKGQDASNIRLGDTLAEDLFAGRTFDFCMSNPPYGVDWKAAEKQVKDERQRDGAYGRFGPGLPPVSDGQMLFLMHLASKMRPKHEGGGRAGIVLNGSPLFTGSAESGSSQIRRWLLEQDLVDAIVALPNNMFFNTGIATYVWILDNIKRDERRGKVQLIDAAPFWTKIRKSLGSKNREIDADARKTIMGLYDAFEDSEHSKVFDNTAFGYWTITVEQPLLDGSGKPLTDRKGNPKPDAKKRDSENVPFTYGGNERGADGMDETIKAYFETEVRPHVPVAWVDYTKTKTGYEIPFTSHFYTYKPPRPLAEIDADLEAQVVKILSLLQEIER